MLLFQLVNASGLFGCYAKRSQSERAQALALSYGARFTRDGRRLPSSAFFVTGRSFVHAPPEPRLWRWPCDVLRCRGLI